MTIIANAELTVAIIGLFLIFLGILMCIEILKRTAERLKRAITYFLIALIPSIFYITWRMLNMESAFTAGKLVSLTLNTLTIAFILLGLYETDKLIKEITGLSLEKKRTEQKKINRENNRKINKEIDIKNIIKRG